jgi:hypothetical protein
MEDYLHAAKVGRQLAVELAQSYLKGYASTWWRTVRQKEGKTHGYTWEFFKECIELERKGGFVGFHLRGDGLHSGNGIHHP